MREQQLKTLNDSSYSEERILIYMLPSFIVFPFFHHISYANKCKDPNRTCEMCCYFLIPDMRGKRFLPSTWGKVMCIFFSSYILSEHEAAGVSSGISEGAEEARTRGREVRGWGEALGKDPRQPPRDVCLSGIHLFWTITLGAAQHYARLPCTE